MYGFIWLVFNAEFMLLVIKFMHIGYFGDLNKLLKNNSESLNYFSFMSTSFELNFLSNLRCLIL